MSPLLALVALQGKQFPTGSIALASTKIGIGKPIKGVLTLHLPAGLHGYQNPPADKFENPITLRVIEKGFRLVKVDYPKGRTLRMPGLGKPTKVYEGKIAIPFQLVASRATPIGAMTDVNFAVRYQLCSLTNCWPPKQLIIKTPLQVHP